MKKTIFSLTTAAVLAAAISGCAAVDSANKWGSDAWITTKLKTEQMGASPAIWSDINVETKNGVVQLSGFAKNQADVAKAVEIARKTDGVKSVVNNVIIRP
ncbi:MAG: BON domain-containing protein [Burkholderiales bacterium]|jgi:osmotically-inducible protein OsmY|nr:BON domain-containing protein [Burkholderiales bacterium]